jgi:CoA:oxalate CoA-transferase
MATSAQGRGAADAIASSKIFHPAEVFQMAGVPRMLEGYRVIDFTQFVAGPVCTRLLAEMGAEVIKVEIAPDGDRVRGAGLKPRKPGYIGSTHSSYYLQHNHSKLSLAMDLKKSRARELITDLVKKADVVVENFAPGVMKRMGFAYDDLKKINPKIIMCSVSMAGQTGPLSDRPGYDYMGQAYAGVTDGLGEAGRPPIVATMAIGDVSTGVAAAMAVGFALIHRERTGEGQHLDASLLDTYFHMHEVNVPMVALRGDAFKPTRNGNFHPTGCLSGIYSCGTGQYVFINVVPHQWPQLVRAMGKPELAIDSRFKGAKARFQNNEALKAIVQGWFAEFSSRDDAIAKLESERVPCAPVLTLNEAVHHPHLNARKTVRWIDDPALGMVAMPGVPVKFSAWPDRTEVRASRLGEDNERVLGGILNLTDSQISELYADAVLVRDAQLGRA